MRAAFHIALKDLRQKLRDRSALLIGIVAPFTLAALFSLILGGLDEDFRADWGFADLDGGEVAAALEAGPIRSLAADGVISVERYGSADEARAAVEAGRIDTAIIVPEGFSAASMSGADATVELVVDPDASISGQVARSVLSGFASEVDAVGLSVATALLASGELPSGDLTSELTGQARAASSPIVIADRAAAAREADYATYYAAAMAILFIFLAAQFGIVSIHAERRAHTLQRMLAAPLPWWSILAGKLMVSMAMALVSMGVIVVGTALLLGAQWGDPLALVLLLLAAALSATGISFLAVAFTRNEEQAGSAVAIVALTLAVIGGSFFPANQGPELLAQLSRITPHAWFLDAVGDIASGGDVASAASAIAVLSLMGLLSGGLGLLRARRLVFG